MLNNGIRLYYKSQLELCYAIRDFIDSYFENKIEDIDLEDNIITVIEANKERFYKDGISEIARKPKQILGKTRLEILQKILAKKGGNSND